ncbi:hypothetical protein [Actinomadura soli]|uniref:hypothetical protein n=1 Tax=Actinomadura soli TaxID=2508997 RepID=UPI001486C703|nr:hypothetical protein [Actinomadura soli]
MAAYLAADMDPGEIDVDEGEDVDQLDDEESFVELGTGRFLAAPDLPVPADLTR